MFITLLLRDVKLPETGQRPLPLETEHQVLTNLRLHKLIQWFSWEAIFLTFN